MSADEDKATRMRPSRPLGITIAAIAVILSGIMLIGTALGMLGFLGTDIVPADGDPQATGWGALLVGVISVVAGVGLLTLKRWAWILALVATGLAVGAAAWALIRHGVDGIVWALVLAGVVAFIILAYLLQRNVKNAFEAWRLEGEPISKERIGGTR
jgi:uncharacterized membrane protein